MHTPQRTTLTVSELNKKAKSLLETHLSQIWVEGELSNFSRPGSGHWYFTLKDSNAQIKCAMFRNRNLIVKHPPKVGDQVLVRARVSLYEPRGDYQLIAEHMQAAGAGLLQQQFEQLKTTLASEGLFDANIKKPIPKHIQKVAIISSPSGAAVHDILNVLERRNAGIEVLVAPSTVQGEGASQELLRALQLCTKVPGIDVIIIGRGGGSIEDLWCFNDEALARSIFACPIPIVSAVGHEVDFSISDFVADVRAPTPSAAAELVSTDNDEWLYRLNEIEKRCTASMSRIIKSQKDKNQQLAKRLKHPGERINYWQQRTDICEVRLNEKIQSLLSSRKHTLEASKKALNAQAPNKRLAQDHSTLSQLNKRLVLATQHQIQSLNAQLAHAAGSLDIVSPLATLKRGYSIVKSDTGTVIKEAKNCTTNDKIQIDFHDGSINAKVLESKS